ncbi:MAG: hypothetical protein HQ562_03580 [Candidatus Marinimicrobia bacterium]|nr:hypothetical protein [Candidatus Neomarinimicrobiota bacterium]
MIPSGGVIGIGIGGSEQDFQPEQFEQVFKNDRDLGFRPVHTPEKLLVL